jgi:hypothetical protein
MRDECEVVYCGVTEVHKRVLSERYVNANEHLFRHRSFDMQFRDDRGMMWIYVAFSLSENREHLTL